MKPIQHFLFRHSVVAMPTGGSRLAIQIVEFHLFTVSVVIGRERERGGERESGRDGEREGEGARERERERERERRRGRERGGRLLHYHQHHCITLYTQL